MFPKVSLHHFGWWWRKCGPIGTVFLILLKFLPLIGYSHASAVGPAYAEPDCSLHKDVLHFWTLFSAIIIEYLLFSVLYWWAFYQNYPKWTAGRVAIPMSCSAAVLVASVFLMMRRKLLSVQYLLLAVRKQLQDPKTFLTVMAELSLADHFSPFDTKRSHRVCLLSSSNRGRSKGTGNDIRPISSCPQ